MTLKIERPAFLLAVAMLIVAAGCVTVPPPSPNLSRPEGTSVLRGIAVGHVLEDQILALDPEHLSASDVATLAKGPTPQIMLLRGGVVLVYLAMESFGDFLVGMGYPEAKIRNPADGDWSYSPYDYSDRLAGIAAWYYEHDGVRPMLVGHSQGGLYAVKIIKELAGQRS